MNLVEAILAIAAIYCAGMYALLAYRTLKLGENWERETFHLGLCFILAVGFLGIIGEL